MGCCFGGRWSGSDEYSKDDDTTPNPNKFKFSIRNKILTENDMVLLLVHYPDCTTYQGLKYILMDSKYYSPDMDELDPHFLEDNHILARFKPNKQGLDLAIACIMYYREVYK